MKTAACATGRPMRFSGRQYQRHAVGLAPLQQHGEQDMQLEVLEHVRIRESGTRGTAAAAPLQ